MIEQDTQERRDPIAEFKARYYPEAPPDYHSAMWWAREMHKNRYLVKEYLKLECEAGRWECLNCKATNGHMIDYFRPVLPGQSHGKKKGNP